MTTTTAPAPAHHVEPIPLDRLDPPADNPREDFGNLDDLAASIESVGLLEPVIVRPMGGRGKHKRYELVAGERRLRAVASLGWEDIPATVRDLSNKEAAEIRLLENLDRESLNPVEEARALERLAELGHDARSLAELTRRSEAAIGARRDLLTLPDAWQDLLKSGDVTPAAAEYVVPFAHHRAVTEAMFDVHRRRWPCPLVEWKRELHQAVLSLSRSMEAGDPTGPRFEPDDEQLEALDVIELALSPKNRVRRAMNAPLWDELQDRADREAAETVPADDFSRNQPADPARDHAASNGADVSDRSDASNATRGKAYTPPKPPRSRPRRQPAQEPEQSAEQLAELVREYKAELLREAITARVDALDVEGLQDLADTLGLDVAAGWSLTRRFCELFQGRNLADLAAELGVDVSPCRDDGERVAVLLHQSPTQVPRILVEA